MTAPSSPQGEVVELRYVFHFDDGGTTEIVLPVNPRTLELVLPDAGEAPDWTALEFEQCPGCPLDPAEHPRRDIAVDLGVRAGIAFPLLTGKEVVGVLEFMSTVEINPQDRILEVTESMGALLGRVVERARGQEALQRSERRLRQIIDLVPHMVFAKTREGHFLLANRSNHRIATM